MRYPANIFTSRHWHENSENCADENSNFLPIYIELDGEKVKLMQLEVSSFLGFKSAQFCGEPIIQYNDLKNYDLISSDQIKVVVKQQLAENNISLLIFRNVREDSYLYEILRQSGGEISNKKAPYINLELMQRLDDYFKTLSASTRKSRKRAVKKIDGSFEVDFEVLTNKNITPELVDEVIAIKAKQLEEMGQTSRLFASQVQLNKLKSIILSQDKDFECVFSILKLNGEKAAVEIGYLFNQQYYSFLGTMDSQFKRYSPGVYQLIKTIDWAIENNIKTFDLLAPEDNYKFSWARHNYINVYDFIFPQTIMGKVAGGLYFEKIRPWLKNIYLFVMRIKRIR